MTSSRTADRRRFTKPSASAQRMPAISRTLSHDGRRRESPSDSGFVGFVFIARSSVPFTEEGAEQYFGLSSKALTKEHLVETPPMRRYRFWTAAEEARRLCGGSDFMLDEIRHAQGPHHRQWALSRSGAHILVCHNALPRRGFRLIVIFREARSSS